MKIVYVVSLFILVSALQSCKDIIAKNISGSTPVMILPQSNDTVQNNPVQFKWEAMEGATHYRLQIASPSFENIQYYILDSLIYTTDFSFSLDSSQFEYKLTAINAGYESKTYGPIKFWVNTVDTTSGSNTTLNLLTPSSAAYFNNDFNGNFTWGSITGGTSYKFELVKGSAFNTGTPIYSSTASLSFETTLPSSFLPLTPGQYFWGVKSYIGNTEQLYVTRNFYIDTLKPTIPLLTSPVNMSTVFSGDIDFNWSFGLTSETFSSPVSSKIELSTDANFTTITNTHTQTAFTKTINLNVGTYYWRVRNRDGAGNYSDYSEVRQLIVN